MNQASTQRLILRPPGSHTRSVILVACYALADGTPTWLQVVETLVFVLVAVGVTTVLVIGLAELVGSRGITIGVMLAGCSPASSCS